MASFELSEISNGRHAVTPSSKWREEVSFARQVVSGEAQWFKMLGAQLAGSLVATLELKHVDDRSVDMDMNAFRTAAQPPLNDGEVADVQVGFKNFGGVFVHLENAVNVNQSEGVRRV